MKNFALIGAAGYIAPRHFQAISATGNRLVAAMDVNDSVGVLDQYFPEAKFFTNFEEFEDYVVSLKGTPDQVEFVSICSPNYLHAAHMKFALRLGADCICEKPLALTVDEIDQVKRTEKECNRKVYTVLQLRVHSKLKQLKEELAGRPAKQVELSYITRRGHWYHHSWKADIRKSGGVATNIGVHFFDLLTWLFGNPTALELHYSNASTQSGYLEFGDVSVKWLLSVDSNRLPESVKLAGRSTYRSIKIDGQEVEFSDGFADLHTEIYKLVLDGVGFGPNDVQAAISVVEQIRYMQPTGISEKSHPLLRNL